MIPPSPILLTLAQIPAKALLPDEPRLPDEHSSVLTILLGVLFVVFVLFIAFKISKRNQAQE